MQQSFYIAIGKLMALLFSFLMPVILTRYLSVDDYGIYSQFYTFLFFIVPVFSCGIPSSLYYFYKNNDQSRKSIVANNFFTLSLITILGSLFLLIPSINHLILGNEIAQFTPYLILCIILLVPTNMIEPLYILRKDKLLMTFYPSIVALLRVSIIIITTLIYQSINAVLISVCLVHLIIFVFTIPYIFRKDGIAYNFVKFIDFRIIKEQMSYGLPFGVAVIITTISNSFDKLVCISSLSPSDYAIYAVSFFGIPGLMQIYDSLCVVNIITMTNFYKKGDLKNVLSSYREFVTKTISFSIPVILIVCLFAKQIISFIFTPNYMAAVPLFQVYIYSFIINMLGAGTILRAINKTKYTFKAQLYTVFITLPFTYFSIKNFGMYGALSGAMLGIILPKILQVYFEIKLLKCNLTNYFPWKSFLKIIIISLSCILPFIVCQKLFDLNIFHVIALSAIYIISAYLIEIYFSVFTISKTQLNSIVYKISHVRKS